MAGDWSRLPPRRRVRIDRPSGLVRIPARRASGQPARRPRAAARVEARKQQRLAEAYVPLLTFAYRVGQWSDLVRPAIRTAQMPPPPPLPTRPQRSDQEGP